MQENVSECQSEQQGSDASEPQLETRVFFHVHSQSQNSSTDTGSHPGDGSAKIVV